MPPTIKFLAATFLSSLLPFIYSTFLGCLDDSQIFRAAQDAFCITRSALPVVE